MKTISYKNNDVSIDINFSIEENTIWMNQKEMATLLNKNFKTISYYIKKMNDYISNNPSVVRNFETTATDGKTYEMSYFYR